MRFCWHIDGTTCPACRDKQIRVWDKPRDSRPTPNPWEPATDYATTTQLKELRREVEEMKKLLQEVLNKLK